MTGRWVHLLGPQVCISLGGATHSHFDRPTSTCSYSHLKMLSLALPQVDTDEFALSL